MYYFLKEHGYQNRVEVIKANNQLPRTEDGLKEKAEELNQRSNLLHEEIKARLSEYYDDEKKELNARYEEQLKILDEVAAIQQEYSTQELEIVWMQAHLAQPSLTDIHRPLSVISEEGEGVTSDDSPTSSRVGVCVGGSLEGAVETEISTSPLAMAGAGFKR